MSAKEYTRLVVKLGTRVEVSRMLGINLSTLYRRIVGSIPISKEMELAIRSLSNPQP